MPLLTGFERNKFQASFQPQSKLRCEWAARRFPERRVSCLSTQSAAFWDESRTPKGPDAHKALGLPTSVSHYPTCSWDQWDNSNRSQFRRTATSVLPREAYDHREARDGFGAENVEDEMPPRRSTLRHKYGAMIESRKHQSSSAQSSNPAPSAPPTPPAPSTPDLNWEIPFQAPAIVTPTRIAAHLARSHGVLQGFPPNWHSQKSAPVGNAADSDMSADEGTPSSDDGHRFQRIQVKNFELQEAASPGEPEMQQTPEVTTSGPQGNDTPAGTTVSQLQGTVVTIKDPSTASTAPPVRQPFEFRASMEPLVKTKLAGAKQRAPKVMLPMERLQGLAVSTQSATANKYSAAARLAAAKAADKRAAVRFDEFLAMCAAEDLSKEEILQLTEGELTELMDALGYDYTYEDRGDIKAQLNVLRAEQRQTSSASLSAP